MEKTGLGYEKPTSMHVFAALADEDGRKYEVHLATVTLLDSGAVEVRPNLYEPRMPDIGQKGPAGQHDTRLPSLGNENYIPSQNALLTGASRQNAVMGGGGGQGSTIPLTRDLLNELPFLQDPAIELVLGGRVSALWVPILLSGGVWATAVIFTALKWALVNCRGLALSITEYRFSADSVEVPKHDDVPAATHCQSRNTWKKRARTNGFM